jgi:hypothetical protein
MNTRIKKTMLITEKIVKKGEKILLGNSHGRGIGPVLQ